MSSAANVPDRKAVLGQIWEVLTTLTDEAQAAARLKCEELGFDPNRGIVTLDETVINLRSARAILDDAIKNRKLVQLPITVQAELLTHLKEISRTLTSLIGGTDEVVNLVLAVERLNTAMWQYGFHNLSKEVLGYQTKLNQIKNQELQLAGLMRELDAGVKTKERLDTLLFEAEEKKTWFSEAVQSIEKSIVDSNALMQTIREEEQKATTGLASIQQSEITTNQLLGNIKVAHGELSGYQTSINEFYSSVEDNKRKIHQITEEAATLKTAADKTAAELTTAAETVSNELKSKADALAKAQENELRESTTANQAAIETAIAEFRAASAELLQASTAQVGDLIKTLQASSDDIISQNNKKTDLLIQELTNLEGQIKVEIEKATGHTLFHSFQKRQGDIAKSKRIWAYALLALVIVSVALTFYVVHSVQSIADIRFAFFVKLSFSLPLIYAIAFCTVQYSKERRLEEEYAFKSNISISLNPYQELVRKLVKDDDPTEMAKYTAFIIESIGKVYSSPTAHVFEGDAHKPALSDKALKTVAEIIEPIVKGLKH